MKSVMWFAAFISAVTLSMVTYAQEEPNPLLGANLYRGYCFVCHGTDGKNKGPVAVKLKIEPSDLTSKKYQEKNIYDLAVTIGDYRQIDVTKMPSWGMVLSKKELIDVASHIKNLNKKDLKFRGDTRRGRAIYNSACKSCHGKRGKGKGLLSHLIQITVIDYTNKEDMKGISDEDIIKAIRKGQKTFMPPWEGIFSDSEIIDVAAYIRMLSN